MNLYFYGGSFDPPHLGHKKIINHFSGKCDKFLVIPTHQSPIKEIAPSSYFHREKMLKLMFELDMLKNISIVDYETENKSRYTVDLIKLIKSKFPLFKINMIIGSDQLNEIKKWKEHDYIINNVKITVISRPNFNFSNKPYIYNYIDEISVDISSSFIRENISNLDAIKTMLDENVMNYIIDNKLYS